ncbi:hypothetical protein VCSRO169_3072 [Vibrio cholerae]|nr:hypothetical protein VCSRO169_3072 [Vibrio cholerae]GIA39125.1 hypothetical protein VCSRO86_0629 [Vibrio cholerae]
MTYQLAFLINDLVSFHMSCKLVVNRLLGSRKVCHIDSYTLERDREYGSSHNLQNAINSWRNHFPEGKQGIPV